MVHNTTAFCEQSSDGRYDDQAGHWNIQPGLKTRCLTQKGGQYHTRDPKASPYFKVVRDYSEKFISVYPERFEERYGRLRPEVPSSLEAFLKCGDIKKGFARLKCKDCGEEIFVGFSCHQRCCCPSCDQKRALRFGYRLEHEVFENVPHRQWTFTMPKRLRHIFLYNRKLLGRLSLAAYEAVLAAYKRAVLAASARLDAFVNPPASASAVAKDDGTITVSITASPDSDVKGYNVCRIRTYWGGNGYDTRMYTTNLTYVDTPSIGESWYYSVTALDTANNESEPEQTGAVHSTPQPSAGMMFLYNDSSRSQIDTSGNLYIKDVFVSDSNNSGLIFSADSTGNVASIRQDGTMSGDTLLTNRSEFFGTPDSLTGGLLFKNNNEAVMFFVDQNGVISIKNDLWEETNY